jgi:hypothetical protein
MLINGWNIKKKTIKIKRRNNRVNRSLLVRTLCKSVGIAHNSQHQSLGAFQSGEIAYKLRYQFVLYLNSTPAFVGVSI